MSSEPSIVPFAPENLRAVIESISSELECGPLLNLLVRHACELIGADNGTIALYDARREVLCTAALYRMPPEEASAEMARGIGLAGQVLLTGQPVILARYGDLPHPALPALSESSVIGMPLQRRGKRCLLL